MAMPCRFRTKRVEMGGLLSDGQFFEFLGTGVVHFETTTAKGGDFQGPLVIDI